MRWLSEFELAVVLQSVGIGHAVTTEIARRLLSEISHYREMERDLNYKVKSAIKRDELIHKPKESVGAI